MYELILFILIYVGLGFGPFALAASLSAYFINRFRSVHKTVRYGLIVLLTLISTPFMFYVVHKGFDKFRESITEYWYKKPFTAAEWRRHQDERHMFVDDLLQRRILIGKTAPEVKAILGAPKYGYPYEGANYLIYDLGRPPFKIVSGQLIVHSRSNRVDSCWASYDD